jgi:hypothetical protein
MLDLLEAVLDKTDSAFGYSSDTKRNIEFGNENIDDKYTVYISEKNIV